MYTWRISYWLHVKGMRLQRRRVCLFCFLFVTLLSGFYYLSNTDWKFLLQSLQRYLDIYTQGESTTVKTQHCRQEKWDNKAKRNQSWMALCWNANLTSHTDMSTFTALLLTCCNSWNSWQLNSLSDFVFVWSTKSIYGTVSSSVLVHAGRFACAWACGFRYVCIPLNNSIKYYVDSLSYFCIMLREKPQDK